MAGADDGGAHDRRQDRARDAGQGRQEGPLAALPEDARPSAESRRSRRSLDDLEDEILRESRSSTGASASTAARFDEIRPITCEVGLLPRTHGSALFTRGETQALVTATLGTSDDAQIIEEYEGESEQTFLLHYNFPPFSVGEAKFMRGPGRREIGHGNLAAPRAHAGAARTRTTSRTRCASSPTSSSPTAPRRWPPSAAARSR